LPQSTIELGELIEDPRSTPLALARLIEKDVSLAARVLRMANSAFYGIAGGVDSLERAVCFLGFSTIHQIAVYLQSRQILDGAGARPPEALWHHAHQVARAARELAQQMRWPMVARFYAAGLLHDLGRVALFCLFPERAQRWKPSGAKRAKRLAEERAVFGLDHQTAGVRLARRWRYPVSLLAVIAGCHGEDNAAQAQENEENLLLAAVSFADGLARAQDDDKGIAGVEIAPDPAAHARLGISAEEQESLANLLRSELSTSEDNEDSHER